VARCTVPAMTVTPLTEADLRAAIEREMPGVRADLERLVRIPGIAFDGFDHTEVDRSAEAVAELARGCGLDVQVARAGGQPAVIGRRAAPPGAPTVLLYAHHDVQPVGDVSLWESDPLEPVEREGRLYGRGAADDKAGVMAHIAALRAFGDALPVGVVLFVEGEEEYGSASLSRLLEKHREELDADVIVLADSLNWAIGTPSLTTSLRGALSCYVEVRTLSHALHSGMFGGPVPDALTALFRLMATLHDDAGDVAVEGLYQSPRRARVDYPVERLRDEAGLLDGVDLIGTGSVADRLWNKPAVTVVGLDAPGAREAPFALVPSARVKLTVRLAPGDDPEKAYAALEAHLRAHAPWGVQVSLDREITVPAYAVEASGPAFDAARAAFRTAWDGVEPVEIGVGGGIPFVAIFREFFPSATTLITGVEDPQTHPHSPNESLHLGEFARVCLAEALLLANLGEAAKAGA
jgi:acetylornithine deacetylase/succinyl-diaminopimelate desuccinylase-like protein